jgi:hypothetical protein
MKHVRCLTIPRMAVEQKADTYKQDSVVGPIIAGGKLLALLAGAGFGIYALIGTNQR